MITKDIPYNDFVAKIYLDKTTLWINGCHASLENIFQILNEDKELLTLIKYMYPKVWEIIASKKEPFFKLGSVQIEDACITYTYIVNHMQTHLKLENLE